MLINPYRERLGVMDGTPFVQERALLESIGVVVPSQDPRRLWTIQSFLLPSRRRYLGGLRTKLQDQKGFITFCNQRDLEVLLGMGQPGETCYWLGRKYVEPGVKDWVGFYADEEDLLDDLYESGAAHQSRLPTDTRGYGHLAGVSRGEFSDKELGSYATRPTGCSICMCQSR